MANARSFLAVPKPDDLESSNEKEKGLFAKIGRRVSALLLSFKDVQKYDNVKLKEMPGKQRMNLLDVYLLKKRGLSFFSEKILRYRSRVFRYPLGRPATIVCEVDAICDSSCDTSRVFKEATLGQRKVNLDLIGKHVPCIFTNDFIHSKRKAFIIGLVSLVAKYYLLPVLVEIVPQHLRTWEIEDSCRGGEKMEENIMKLVASIYTKSFLGIEFDFEWIQLWTRNISKTSRERKACKVAYMSMYRAVKDCPRYEEMLLFASKYRIPEKDMINEVLFVLLFNSIPTTAYALSSAIGRLASVSTEMTEQINDEASYFMRNGIQSGAINKLILLDNFVLEVLRLNPPVPIVFGIARSMYVLFSFSGNFTINEGDILAGNLYEAHRDPEIFTDPKEFDPSRFIDECLKDSLLSFGGRLTDKPKSSNRKCPGQKIALTILKVCLLNILECDCMLKEKTVFEDQRTHRMGKPDQPLVLDYFKFHLPHWWELSMPTDDDLSYCRSIAENSESTLLPATSDGNISEASYFIPSHQNMMHEEVNRSQRSCLYPSNLSQAMSMNSQRSGSSLSEVDIN